MKRRAQSVDIIMKIAFALIVFAVLIFVFKPYAEKAFASNGCEGGAGQCKASCNLGAERQTGGFCKDKTQVCCVGTSTNSGTGPSGSGSGSSTTTTGGETLQTLSMPTIKFFQGAQQSPSRISVVGGLEKDAVLVADISVPYYDPAALAKSSLSAADKQICNPTKDTPLFEQKGVCKKEDWVINITLETVATKRVLEYKYDLMGEKVDSIKSYSIGNDGKPIPGPKYLIGEAQPMEDSAIKGVSYMKRAREIVTLHLNSSLAKDFAGQSVNLVITVHPAGNPTSQITSQYRVAIASSLLARYEGLSQVWSQEKAVNTYCDKENIRCDMMAFSTQTDAVCPDDPKIDAKQQLTITQKVYYITKPDGTVQSTTQYETQSSCENAIIDSGGAIDAQLLSAASAVSKASGTGTDLFQNKELANLLNKQNSNFHCEEKSFLKITSDNVQGPYLTDTFDADPAIQKGTIRLAQASMAGRYLCVYGHDTRTDKWYSAGNGQKIMVDRTAPQVNITFYAWSGYRVVVECADGKPKDPTESGCKPNFEYAYVSDPVKFLSALASGPQTAAKWCPTSGYITTNQRSFNYNYDGIRVLCARWQDNAGNQGLSMVTVYNSYELLAKAIMMNQQQKAK